MIDYAAIRQDAHSLISNVFPRY